MIVKAIVSVVIGTLGLCLFVLLGPSFLCGRDPTSPGWLVALMMPLFIVGCFLTQDAVRPTKKHVLGIIGLALNMVASLCYFVMVIIAVVGLVRLR
jgi:hypothetical protein